MKGGRDRFGRVRYSRTVGSLSALGIKWPNADNNGIASASTSCISKSGAVTASLVLAVISNSASAARKSANSSVKPGTNGALTRSSL